MASFALTLLVGAATVWQARLLSQAIAAVFIDQQGLAAVKNTVWLFFFITLLRVSSQWAGQSILYSVSASVKRIIRQQVTARLQQLGPSYAFQQQAGELKSTLTAGIERLEAFFSDYLPQLVTAVVIPVLVLIFIIPGDYLSALIFLLTAPLIPFFMMLIGDVARARTQRQWHVLGRLNAFFAELLQGLVTIKMLGCGEELAKKIRQVTDEFRTTTMSTLRIAFLSALVLELLSTLSIAIIAVQIGLRLLYGKLAYEQALFILILAPEFYQPLRRLGAQFHAGLESLSAAKRLFAILDEKPTARQGRIRPASSQEDIVFEDVYYTYPNREAAALQALSFRIEAGQKTALVGPSGAGKSTVIALLLRFIDPQRGNIFIGSQPLTGIDVELWRSGLTWAPQRPFLFQTNIADNIRLGDPQASLERVIQATTQAHLHEFIEKLPQGYDTLIGERGVSLSGGQAQRLALARAFLKEASFIILDEPTSALDQESEAAVARASAELIEGKTVLTIAHRLHTIEQYDQILFMEQGCIVENGTHQALMRKTGRYAQYIHSAGAVV